MNALRPRGFTLIEVLVALALVATALGGTLAVVREAITNQQYLERRLLAQWVAATALEQFILEHTPLEAGTYPGHERILGRRFTYVIAVALRPAPAPPTAAKETDPKPAATMEIAVEVRDAFTRNTPLVRAVRVLKAESAT